MELSDGIVLVRPFELSDAKRHLWAQTDVQVKALSGGATTLFEVEDWIIKIQEELENNGNVLTFAIVDSLTRLACGIVVIDTDWQKYEGFIEGDVNIAYGLYPDSGGRGYLSNAVQLLTRYLVELGYRRAIVRRDLSTPHGLQPPIRCNFVKEREIKTKTGRIEIYVEDMVRTLELTSK